MEYTSQKDTHKYCNYGYYGDNKSYDAYRFSIVFRI